MNALPTSVFAKDLQLRMRGWRWAGVASLYASILAAIAVAFLVHRYSLVAGESTQAGIHLFQALAFGEVFLIVFVTPASLAGAISGERQHRTWDLLITSPVPLRHIVWGKLLAGIAFNLTLLATSLPLFGLVFLFAGMTPAAMLPALLVLLVTVLLLGTTSLAISALTARLTVSYMLSMLLALLLAVGLSLVTLYVVATGGLSLFALGSLPFQADGSSVPLPPIAQFDPFIALLSALPGDSGGTLLGGLGTIHHAFGLPWRIPLWGAYLVLSVIISLLIILLTPRMARAPWSDRRRHDALPYGQRGADR